MLRSVLSKLLPTVFPNVPLEPIEVDSEGWYLYLDGARRHKHIKQDDGEFVCLAWYSSKHEFTTQGRESAAFPPLHWHWAQDEAIKILSGRAGYVLDDKVGYAVAGETIWIPRGTVHTFWLDPTYGEDCLMEISARPGDGIDAIWINNVYGIMHSLNRQGKTLDLMHAAVIALESASAPGQLPKWLGVIATYSVGYFAKMLGYRADYPVYSKVILSEAN